LGSLPGELRPNEESLSVWIFWMAKGKCSLISLRNSKRAFQVALSDPAAGAAIAPVMVAGIANAVWMLTGRLDNSARYGSSLRLMGSPSTSSMRKTQLIGSAKRRQENASRMNSIPEATTGRKLARQAVIFALLGWPAADLAVVVGLLISGTTHASTSDWLLMLFQVGLIGISAGLTVWVLHRLIRLAAKNDPR
jgi:hypothetical protein